MLVVVAVEPAENVERAKTLATSGFLGLKTSFFPEVNTMEKMWSAEKEMIHFFAHLNAVWITQKKQDVQKNNFCGKLFLLAEKNAEKPRVLCGIMRNKHIFPRFLTSKKTPKTLTTSGFFEFFTKFSTTCGKLYLQVGNFFRR